MLRNTETNENKVKSNADHIVFTYYEYHGEPSEGDDASELYYGYLKGVLVA